MVTQHFTIREVAALIGSTEKALRNRLARGQFPFRRLGRRVLIPADELEKFLAGLPGRTAREVSKAMEDL
jgi:excisionase family DNA binding protein